MQCAQTLLVVVVVGLRFREFCRLRAKVVRFGLPVDLVNGGHISEGSNACRDAQSVVNRADLVLWNPNGARHFSAGVIPSLHVRRIHGVSGARRAIVEWINSPPGKNHNECMIDDTVIPSNLGETHHAD